MAHFDVFSESDPSSRLATFAQIEDARRFVADRPGGHVVFRRRRLTGLELLRAESSFTEPAVKRRWVAASNQQPTRRFAGGAIVLALSVYCLGWMAAPFYDCDSLLVDSSPADEDPFPLSPVKQCPDPEGGQTFVAADIFLFAALCILVLALLLLAMTYQRKPRLSSGGLTP